MKKSTWLQVVLAAVVVVVAGAVLGFACEDEIRVKVMKTDGDLVTITTNGTTEELTLEDLEEGETRTFTVGEHEVTVMRVGDELTVTLDDGELAGLLEGVKGKKISKRVVVVTDDCEGEAKADAFVSGGSKHVIIHRAGGEIEIESELFEGLEDLEDLEEHGVRVHRIGKGDGHKMIFISEGDEGRDEGELAFLLSGEDHDFHWVGAHGPGCHGDYVTYECPEDGTRLQLKKDKDQADSHLCPLCGAAMEKLEGPEIVRKKVLVELIEAVEEESADKD